MGNTNQNSRKEQKALDLITQGKLKAATEIYKEIIATGSNKPFIFNNLGLTQFQLGESKASISSFQKALQLNPKYSQAHSNLGMVLTSIGSKKDAIFSLNKFFLILMK